MERNAGDPGDPPGYTGTPPEPSLEAEQTLRRSALSARENALSAAQRCSVRLDVLSRRLAPASRVLDDTLPQVAELRQAIEEYVTAMRADGEPPETALVLVKRMIAEVDNSPDDGELLRRSAVDWTIQAYYTS